MADANSRAVQKIIVRAKRKVVSKEMKQEIPEETIKDVEKKYNHKCAICKRRPCTLQIHHKNMKNEDNSLDNLELLCPKHHTQKHTKRATEIE